jgi:hypothetical protein
MGPREALERLRILIKDALTTSDIEAAHKLLREMNLITEQAIGRGRLRRGRLLLLRSTGRS